MLDHAATSLCPSCGVANQCAVAAEDDPARCWCRRVDFTGIELPSDRSRCLCVTCVEQLRHAASETGHAR